MGALTVHLLVHLCYWHLSSAHPLETKRQTVHQAGSRSCRSSGASEDQKSHRQAQDKEGEEEGRLETESRRSHWTVNAHNHGDGGRVFLFVLRLLQVVLKLLWRNHWLESTSILHGSTWAISWASRRAGGLRRGWESCSRSDSSNHRKGRSKGWPRSWGCKVSKIKGRELWAGVRRKRRWERRVLRRWRRWKWRRRGGGLK